MAELAAEAPGRRYDAPHILWYFGAITAALAINALVATVHPSGRGVWQLLVGLLLLAVLAGSAAVSLRAGWWVPAGVLTAAAVTVVPAVGQAFERLIGVWPSVAEQGPSAFEDFQGAIFALGLATILVGLVAFWLVRFPFVLVPVAVATLLTAQLLVPLLVDHPSTDHFAKTALVSGGVLLLAALLLDGRSRRADAFWWHVFGLLAIAIGLGWYTGVRGAGWAWLAILVLGAILLLASAPLARATWATYGVLGVYAALLHYVDSWAGSWKVPTLMILVSLGLIALGIALQVSGRFRGQLDGPPASTPEPAAGPPTTESVPEPPAPEPGPPQQPS